MSRTQVLDTPLDTYIDGPFYNGPIVSKSMAHGLDVSLEGCPCRGTDVCTRCPFAPAVECSYRCRYEGQRRKMADCKHRGYCKCGHDQTERLRAWGLVE